MKFLVYIDIDCRSIEHGKAIIDDMINHRKIFSGGIEPMKISWTVTVMPSVPEREDFEKKNNLPEGSKK